MRRGPDLALIKGSGPEYDVATMLRISRDDQPRLSGQCRVVLPEGMEAIGLRYITRGEELHAFRRSSWYRIDIDRLGTGRRVEDGHLTYPRGSNVVVAAGHGPQADVADRASRVATELEVGQPPRPEIRLLQHVLGVRDAAELLYVIEKSRSRWRVKSCVAGS